MWSSFYLKEWDLRLEADPEELKIIQKLLIKLCYFFTINTEEDIR
jgi:hypothetical protein